MIGYRVLRLTLILIALAGMSTVAFGQKQLEVNAVSVDESATQIKITGRDFGSEAPKVLLGLSNGETVELKTAYVSGTEIVAFYDFFRLKPGTYRLTVSSKTLPNQVDSLGITIGAVVSKIDRTDLPTNDRTGKSDKKDSPDIITPSESATGMYVDLTTNQTVGGEKTFTAKLTGTTVSANQFDINGKGRFIAAPGFKNTFVGENTGAANATSYNSFFGGDAGQSTTTGQRNSFFGYTSGGNNTTGTRNAFFGSESGAANTTGMFNSFFGSNAGTGNTTAIRNTFLGGYAGYSTTIGADNTYVGAAAGFTSSTGANNSFVGSGAGNLSTSGSNNSFFGQNAGTANTMGSNNSLFGQGSNVSSGALTFATAIGSGASVSTSNTVQLGRDGSDDVRIGRLSPTAGSTFVCLNANDTLATCSATLVTTTGTQTLTNKTLTAPTINGGSITGLSNPVNAGDAANKAYVDAAVMGGGGGGGATGVQAETTANIAVTGTTNIVSIALQAGQTYKIQAEFYGTVPMVGSADADLQFVYTGNATSTAFFTNGTVTQNATFGATPVMVGDMEAFLTGAQLVYAVELIITTTTAGTLTIRGANPTGQTITIIPGSWVIAIPLN